GEEGRRLALPRRPCLGRDTAPARCGRGAPRATHALGPANAGQSGAFFWHRRRACYRVWPAERTGEAECRAQNASRGNAPQAGSDARRRKLTGVTIQMPWHAACSACVGCDGEALADETVRAGSGAAHEALHGVQAREAAQRLLAPRRLSRRPGPLVRRVPRGLLPEVVRDAPRRVQHAAARVLPAEPRPPARIQPRVPAPPPPADARGAVEAAPHFVTLATGEGRTTPPEDRCRPRPARPASVSRPMSGRPRTISIWTPTSRAAASAARCGSRSGSPGRARRSCCTRPRSPSSARRRTAAAG